MSELFHKIKTYLCVCCERLQREGNYRYHVQEFASITLSSYELTPQINIETLINKRDLHLYYEWVMKIVQPFRISYPIRSFPFWDHPSDQDADFELHESELHDNAFLMEHAINRFGKIQYCKESSCTKLLTLSETEYCIECQHSIKPIDCAICLDSATKQPTLTTQCGHVYHMNCFRAIPHDQSTIPCPLCRKPCHHYIG